MLVRLNQFGIASCTPKMQDFIYGTKVPFENINLWVHEGEVLRVIIKKPYCVRGKDTMEACRFSLRDADRIRLWWVK